MNTVVSRDGTTIAYDKQGKGPPVILVGGGLNSRAFGPTELATFLAPQFTTYIHDRRGRGDSGDTPPYAVGREIEDIEALIDVAGEAACVYGHSSGAALGMEAAIKLGDKVRKLAMYEAPYFADDKAQRAFEVYGTRLGELVSAGRRTAAGRRADAVALFLNLVGVPADQIEGMRETPIWPAFLAAAPTLTYDYAILGKRGEVPTERAAGVTVPVLVMNGGASPLAMRETAQLLSEAMPHADHRIIEGQRHDVSQEVLAPVLAAFFAADEG
jgi:pimeloyl-ACP methyl ester carboxylesterase